MDWKDNYNSWINNPNLDPELKNQLLRMNHAEIEDAFFAELEFGTGGMRGIVGPGINRMNLYTIRKANTGFAEYLVKNVPESKDKGIVIAFDNRHFSREFALESAKVMATHGIKAYLFDSLRPTPELSFAVRYLKAAGGIVVTASHNPSRYNGYKIYDQNGCQLVPHLADEVIKHVEAVKDVFAITVEDELTLRKAGLIVTVGDEIDAKYLEEVKTIQINKDLDKTDLKIVFTPLHGTSYKLGPRILSECGYTNVYPVKEQLVNDPDFGTVKSPNPEDGSAFAYAIRLGEAVDADILIATDPDADRIGLAVRDNTGKYILLTGNQTGAVLVHYILSQRKLKGTLPSHGVVFNTIVTSSFGAAVAKSYGLEVESTLTGFKFIGEKAAEIENTEKEYVFGYEESYGYLIKPFVRDKDSIQSVLMCAEAAAYYKKQGKTLYNVLFELYREYGYYIESLVNIALTGIEGKEKIDRIMNDFRNNKPEQVGNFKVVAFEDYLTGIRLDQNGESKLTLPQSNVVKFFLEDGSWFVLRPSGTEPKLKIYVGVESPDYHLSEDKNELIKQYAVDRISQLA